MKSLPLLPDMEELEKSLTEQAKREVPLASPFFIEGWPKALLALSVSTEILPLSQDELAAMLRLINETWEHKPTTRDDVYVGLLDRLHTAIENVGGKAFIRTGSRSPKDNPCFMDMALKPIPIYSGQSALDCLAYSERVYLDLNDARRAEYLPSLCVRRFVEFEPESEFRCFVENGTIAGITQYHIKDGAYRWIVKNAVEIESRLRSYLTDVLMPAANMPSFTADIILRPDMLPFLLEINPPVTTGKVFPGLFAGRELDGEFLYIKPGAEP
jgi:hypothetical protein